MHIYRATFRYKKTSAEIKILFTVLITKTKMSSFTPKTILFLAAMLLMSIIIPLSESALNSYYYSQTCPEAEKIILATVYNATIHDPKVPARILRMFFHDCFVRGCDASVLLDSTPGNQAEKDGPPNISLASFYVIDDAKTKLESACPGTVSCSDILSIAARDVVTISGGPYWNVRKGRKDGRVSKASETINLPAPTMNVSQLAQSFAMRGLGLKDLVALSGGHTLGFSHCSSFEARIRNFSSTHDIDPALDSTLAQQLRAQCPKPNRDRNAGQFLDSTSAVFDNAYYKGLLARKGVFSSDQSLMNDYGTKWIVESFARDQTLFFKEFAASMIKLGNVGVIENGEVRAKCRVVN